MKDFFKLILAACGGVICILFGACDGEEYEQVVERRDTVVVIKSDTLVIKHDSTFIPNIISRTTLYINSDTLNWVYDGEKYVPKITSISYVMPCMGDAEYYVSCDKKTAEGIHHSVSFYTRPTQANVTSISFRVNKSIKDDKGIIIHTAPDARFLIICAEDTIRSLDVYFRTYLSSKPLYKKKVVCFGDSQTEFNDINYMTWVDFFSVYTGCDAYNLGIGDTRLAPRVSGELHTMTNNKEAYAYLDILNMVRACSTGDFSRQADAAIFLKTHANDDNQRIIATAQNIDYEDVDLFIVFGGLNDFSAEIEPGDWQSDSEGTICGAMNEIIKILSLRFPHAIIMTITPSHRTFEYAGQDHYPDTYQNTKGYTLYDIAQLLEETSNRQHIPCLNLMREGFFNNFNHSEYFRNPDGTINQVHSYSGYNFIGKIVAAFVASHIIY